MRLNCLRFYPQFLILPQLTMHRSYLFCFVLLFPVMPLHGAYDQPVVDGFRYVKGDGFITIVGYEGSESEVSFPESIQGPGSWAHATDEGNGWKTLDWFGSFYEGPSGWIYHLDYGWLRVEGSAESNLHLYSPETDEWWWLSVLSYPQVFGFGSEPGWTQL